MMNKLVLFFFLLISGSLFAQTQSSQKINYDEKMAWWRNAKFGLFVHWGPYALYGGVYNGFNQHRGDPAWIMNRCKIPFREYRAKAHTFNPVEFNADALVSMAKEAGMKYVVFTTKHHDGFAMFKSNASNFNIIDYTHFNRDIVDEVVQACRKHGLKIGFYYSQSQDWCTPGGAVARKEMWEGWPNPDSTEINNYAKANGGHWDHLQTTVSFDTYFHKVAIPQIKELLDRYKDIAIIWFDTPMGITNKQAAEVRELLDQYPQIIVNDRLKRPNFLGDYKTPEGIIPKAKDIEGVDWESCMNIGTAWGYRSWGQKWKSADEIIHNMITIAARGGNFLLNVGPDALGNVPEEAQACLKSVGEWMKVNGEIIYNSQRSMLTPEWGECIRKESKNSSTLYLCVFDWPESGKLKLNCNHAIKKVTFMSDQSTLKHKTKDNIVTIDISDKSPDKTVTIIKVDLKKKLPAVKLIQNSQKTFKIEDV